MGLDSHNFPRLVTNPKFEALLKKIAKLFATTAFSLGLAVLGWSVSKPDDPRRNVEGVFTKMNPSRQATLTGVTNASFDPNLARTAIFGEVADLSVPDWVMFYSHDGNLYQGLSGYDNVAQAHPDGKKGKNYPYLIGREYIYVVFATDNKDLISYIDAQKAAAKASEEKVAPEKPKAEKPKAAEPSKPGVVHVSLSSLAERQGNFRTFLGLASSLFGKPIPERAKVEDANSDQPLDFRTISEKGSPLVYAAIAKVPVNTNSECRLVVDFPENTPTAWTKGNSLATYAKFGVIPEGSQFGISLGAFVGGSGNPNITSDYFALNSVQLDLLGHFYGRLQHPFRAPAWDTFNIFLGTPIVGGSSGKLLQSVHVGVGWSDVFEKDFGLNIGWGWDFSALPDHNQSLIAGLDFKL